MKPLTATLMNHPSRRHFFKQTALLAGSALLAPALLPAAPAAAKRTAVDQMTLGKTGIRLSRLGMGTGSDSGNVQFRLGQEAFNKLVRYAYEQGITYFDCAQSYQTFNWIGDAIKGLPREKLYIQSKIMGKPQNPAETIDNHLRIFKTDYIDSMLVHCMTKDNWTDDFKRLMDAIEEAQQKKKIRARGVSCHSLPALRVAAASKWVEVNLVRINPQCAHIDGMSGDWNKSGTEIEPVLKEIKTMDEGGHGIIGMKMIGNGDFRNAEDREKSIRYAMSRPELDAVVIGFKSSGEIDEAIQRMNSALAG
jgi:predicted aldo/keto reductase-like oxidoreductase